MFGSLSVNLFSKLNLSERIENSVLTGIFLCNKVTVFGLNISRYTNNGGSYRNIQRFFQKNIIGQK